MSRRGGLVRKIFLPTPSSYLQHPIRRGRKILGVEIFCRLGGRGLAAKRRRRRKKRNRIFVTEDTVRGHRGSRRRTDGRRRKEESGERRTGLAAKRRRIGVGIRPLFGDRALSPSGTDDVRFPSAKRDGARERTRTATPYGTGF